MKMRLLLAGLRHLRLQSSELSLSELALRAAKDPIKEQAQSRHPIQSGRCNNCGIYLFLVNIQFFKNQR